MQVLRAKKVDVVELSPQVGDSTNEHRDKKQVDSRKIGWLNPHVCWFVPLIPAFLPAKSAFPSNR